VVPADVIAVMAIRGLWLSAELATFSAMSKALRKSGFVTVLI
jgi:hypothetical protein